MTHPAFENLDFSQLPDEDEKAWIARILPSYEDVDRLLRSGHQMTADEIAILGPNMVLLKKQGILLSNMFIVENQNKRNMFGMLPYMADIVSEAAMEKNSVIVQWMHANPRITWREAVTKFYGV